MYALFKNQLEELLELHTRKGRKEQGYFLIEGEKIIQDAVAAGWIIQGLIVTEEASKRYAELIEKCTNSIPMLATQEQMRKLSETVTPTGILAILCIPSPVPLPSTGHVLALDDISDPGNLGTIMRTADWFGIKDLMLSPNTVDEFNGKVIRAAMGSLFHIRFHRSEQFEADLRALQQGGYTVVVTTVSGNTHTLKQVKKMCLVLGSEAHGVSKPVEAMANSTYTIAGSGDAESLNVAVSGAIALYELSK